MKADISESDNFQFLLSGIDTLECAYFLISGPNCQLDYEHISNQKESARQSKSREPKLITLADVRFFLHGYGSSSGFPFIIENEDFVISFGEFNLPSFHVKFKCIALWRHGASVLHNKFISWARSAGLSEHGKESLSRVDFAFDYEIPVIDFDEDSFISLSKKDSRYRKDGKLQTLQFGKGDVVLRLYDKVAEIQEKSNKHWFYELWGVAENVWRIEWQTRKKILRRFGIRTFEDLKTNQGDLLRYLVTEHDSLRQPSEDQNRSRWPIHPLLKDLEEQTAALDCVGIYREIDPVAILEERNIRIAISIYGYLKRIAAIECILKDKPMTTLDESISRLISNLKRVHNFLTWETDVEKRVNQIRLGRW